MLDERVGAHSPGVSMQTYRWPCSHCPLLDVAGWLGFTPTFQYVHLRGIVLRRLLGCRGGSRTHSFLINSQALLPLELPYRVFLVYLLRWVGFPSLLLPLDVPPLNGTSVPNYHRNTPQTRLGRSADQRGTHHHPLPQVRLSRYTKSPRVLSQDDMGRRRRYRRSPLPEDYSHIAL